MTDLPPATVMIVGALLLPLMRGRLQSVYLLALPILSLLHLLQFTPGIHGRIELFDYTLACVRVDKLSLVFGIIFHIMAILGCVYALHLRDRIQHGAGLVYAGSAIAAVFAGDLITLFVAWEVTAISSVLLIWSRRTERAYAAGMRYLIIQVSSGLILLAGILLHYQATGSLAFGKLGAPGLSDPGSTLIFVAFAIKCAFPLLHNWLQDAYPEATVTGTVFLSAFTTKMAVYALARGFAGTEILIPIGAVMTAFPVFYAVIENDLRRVLAYSLNNQLGFMVVGIGVGSELGINGAVSHAFVHILYKALLFMSMGAVLHRVGTIRASDLGGIYKSMPLTAAFCIVGAASISAFPLFSGFVTKSLTLAATADGGHTAAFFILLFASAGVLHHSGIKIPFYGFFGRDSGIRCREAPLNMLVAMGAAAFLCVAIGVYPQPLYALLPYPVEFEPYTSSHVVTQLQLLFFAILAFAFLARRHLESEEIPCTNLDADWIYRRLLPASVDAAARAGRPLLRRPLAAAEAAVDSAIAGVRRLHGPQGIFGRTWLTSSSVLLTMIFLMIYLIFNLG